MQQPIPNDLPDRPIRTISNLARPEANCPYCQTKQRVIVARYRPELAYCDPELGGCDRYFLFNCAAFTTYSVTVSAIDNRLQPGTQP